MKLQEKYILSKCCSPSPGNEIVGYFSHDDLIKVHAKDCPNLAKADPSRVVSLKWDEIRSAETSEPKQDYEQLEGTDFDILKHHRDYDIDYSLKVARVLNIDKQEAFNRHQKLREMGLLERVDALMVQYRKKVADNKWIKHRNHTYYRLTDKGGRYLEYYLNRKN